MMTVETNDVWKSCLEGVSEHVSPQHYETWFKPIKALGTGPDGLELEVPNHFFLEWVKEHYLLLIQEVLKKVVKRDVGLVWKVGDGARAPAAKASQKEQGARPSRQASLGFNPKYTFDNFVVGKANEFARAACYAVANHHIASKYNPLFIYGCVGLGKTHLLQAIGQAVLEKNPGAKVCYYTSERFMNEFINHVSRGKMSDFRGRFRNVDVLLIDDIQFWGEGDKGATQEEFFHTFNALYESHKQIVVTSDQFPKDMDGIQERLRSRFEWGLVADIKPPDIETKTAILKKKAKAEGIRLPDDVSGWLASVSGANVRELEGFLTRIIAVSNLSNEEITLAMSKETLKNLLKVKEEKFLTIDEIQKAVSAFYKIKTSDLKSSRRHRAIALPRHVAMFLARECGRFSFPEIGSAFGGKDHSTAIHAVKKIEREIKESTELKMAVGTIRQALGVA
jgi:chromosomal replication initiator protein